MNVTKAPNSTIFATTASYSLPSSGSAHMSSIFSLAASATALFSPKTLTLPSSCNSIVTPNSSCSPFIVEPPFPITTFTLSLWTLNLQKYGAKLVSSLAFGIASSMIPRICILASRACVRAFSKISSFIPSILISICKPETPFFVPATLKSISPR